MELRPNMKLRPLGNRVLVRPEEALTKTASGIVLPENAKEKPQVGKVIAIGTGKVLDNGTKVPMEVKTGDRILYSKYAGTEIKIGGDEHLILAETEILAIAE
jgi:chaperonin GroES